MPLSMHSISLALFSVLLAIFSFCIVQYVPRHAPRRLEAGHTLDPSPLLHKPPSLDVPVISVTTTTFSTVYSMSYSWEGIATAVDPDDWLDECFMTFQEHCSQCSASDPSSWVTDYSNYELIAKPAGLCAEFLACAFTKCDHTGFDEVFFALNLANSSFKDVKDKLGPLNLPQKIAFPATVFDVVGTVAQAIEEGRTISIKSTGHSYTGSHTMNGSIQLNFRDLQAYSSVVECPPFLSNASDNFAACLLANARGKDALVRVGGGQTWNDIYWGVFDSAPQYEPLGGGAGSVGAAGGWLQGGGLSAGAERMYGLGVDQVLEIEMVLPDTRHVKFGPSNWEDAPGFLYPRTTAVEGLCNSNVVEDESQWVWGACEDPTPPFADLWFAVRGGGGGTYGALTSLKYQLHEALPRYYLVINETSKDMMGDLMNISFSPENQAAAYEILDQMSVFFFVDLLYNPQELDLNASTSNQCGSPGLTFEINGPLKLICYGDAADQVIESWQTRVKQTVESFPRLQRFASLLDSYIVPLGPFTSFATAEVFLYNSSRVPNGYIPDIPPPTIIPFVGYHGWCSALLPTSWLANAGNDVYQILSVRSGQHTTGGNVATAHDQMTAISKPYRNSGLASVVLSYDIDQVLHERLLSSFLEDAITNNSSFPGISEWNHICVDSFGPLKTNMSVPCPANFTDAQKEENCYSLQESNWGLETLGILENIKYSVDPENLFDCYACVKPKQSR